MVATSTRPSKSAKRVELHEGHSGPSRSIVYDHEELRMELILMTWTGWRRGGQGAWLPRAPTPGQGTSSCPPIYTTGSGRSDHGHVSMLTMPDLSWGRCSCFSSTSTLSGSRCRWSLQQRQPQPLKRCVPFLQFMALQRHW